jgi:hypothetical protein
VRIFFSIFSSYYGIDYGLVIFHPEQDGNVDIVHSAGICTSGVGLSKIRKRAELDLPVLSHLDLDICSYVMR